MDTNIKLRQIANLDAKFKSLYEKIIQQLSLFEEIFLKGQKEELIESAGKNKTEINRLENAIREDFVKSMLLFAPRAIELRKIIVYQDITNFFGRIGDALMHIITLQSTKKIDLNLPDFNYFRVTLGKMLSFTKKMVGDAIFSFYYGDADAAYRTISDDNVVDRLYNEISENALLHFQDAPLDEQELVNIISISNIAYIVEQIGDIATHIAEASIYLIEGNDIRHGFSDT